MSPKTARLQVPIVDSRRCKRCGLCVAFCPREAIELAAGVAARLVRPEACNGCGTCELICPDFAIAVVGGTGAR